jgi:hypothetical protein
MRIIAGVFGDLIRRLNCPESQNKNSKRRSLHSRRLVTSAVNMRSDPRITSCTATHRFGDSNSVANFRGKLPLSHWVSLSLHQNRRCGRCLNPDSSSISTNGLTILTHATSRPTAMTKTLRQMFFLPRKNSSARRKAYLRSYEPSRRPNNNPLRVRTSPDEITFLPVYIDIVQIGFQGS